MQRKPMSVVDVLDCLGLAGRRAITQADPIRKVPPGTQTMFFGAGDNAEELANYRPDALSTYPSLRRRE